MKRILAAILIIVCLASSAYAEFDQLLLIKYESAAEMLGAPDLQKSVVSSFDNYFQFDFGQLEIVFEMAPDNSVKNIVIYAEDDACAADFLGSCIATIYTFGDIDVKANGMLLMQFMSVRAGGESVPYNIGKDTFMITTRDMAKYVFIYMNIDTKNR